MDIQHTKLFLDQVATIVKHYDKIAELTGSDFNIFKIIDLSTKEVRLHSCLIAELLNPKGSHGQGDRFLKAFISVINNSIVQGQTLPASFCLGNFDTASAKVEVEFYIGAINREETEGGRIDIHLEDGLKQHILIENKIDAVDQPNQLLRYHNYDQKALLLYLTQDGRDPSEASVGGKTASKERFFQCLSYKTTIVRWLEACQKEAAALPLVRESIVQYINLVKNITNQSERLAMQDDIKNMIKKNPDYIKIIEDCDKALASLADDTVKEIHSQLKKVYPKTIKELADGSLIKVEYGEDGGLYFTYRLFKDGKNISDTDLAIPLKRIMEEIDEEKRFDYRWKNICWFQPKPFTENMTVAKYKRQELVNMASDSILLTAFVAGLIEQELAVTQQFINKHSL